MVDRVWHLHLVYTQNYWEDLCGDVLPVPQHHGPTRGGASERSRFIDQYALTLDSYRRFFAEPDPTVWSDARERFRQSIHSANVVLGTTQFRPKT
ncbi:MAG: TIGR04222 domain-containing membrane protein, partial [Planctomycetota bacterium]